MCVCKESFGVCVFVLILQDEGRGLGYEVYGNQGVCRGKKKIKRRFDERVKWKGSDI